jgi:hypothetical protein
VAAPVTAASVVIPDAQIPVPVVVSDAEPKPEAGTPATEFETPQQNARVESDEKGDYIDRMKAAGYDVDLDKYIAMKVQDITPEYARAMSQLGFGKMSADDLIACKPKSRLAALR